MVAGLFWRGPCVLIQQRPAHKNQGLLWEFPGGKVETGESDAQALARECQEELGVSVQVGPLAWETRHLYGEVWVTLCLYHAHMHAAAEPQPHEAAQLQWRPTAALTELDFCPADVGLVQDLAARRGGWRWISMRRTARWLRPAGEPLPPAARPLHGGFFFFFFFFCSFQPPLGHGVGPYFGQQNLGVVLGASQFQALVNPGFYEKARPRHVGLATVWQARVLGARGAVQEMKVGVAAAAIHDGAAARMGLRRAAGGAFVRLAARGQVFNQIAHDVFAALQIDHEIVRHLHLIAATAGKFQAVARRHRNAAKASRVGARHPVCVASAIGADDGLGQQVRTCCAAPQSAAGRRGSGGFHTWDTGSGSARPRPSPCSPGKIPPRDCRPLA